MTTKNESRKTAVKFTILISLPIIVFFVSLSIGRYPVSLDSLFQAFWKQFTSQPMSTGELALIRVRLPRTIVALIVGASLSASGAVFQGLFMNPIVSPDLLGTSSGASFGATLAILLGLSTAGIQSVSFLFGIIAVLLVYFMSKLVSRHSRSIVNLILCGMLVSSVFTALVSFMKFIADTDTKLPAITFWLMGSLSAITIQDLKIFFLFAPICIVLLIVRWKINILSLGDEEAKMLGVHVSFYRWLLIACATLLTSLSVSISGNIGWVGLIVPHLARFVVGSNYAKVIPASMLIGSSFLLAVDTVARTILTVEIPLGIITSLIGAPFFFFLLLQSKKKVMS